MSKSKGNGVDPVEIIETHGADALRFSLTQMATETQDVRLPVKKDAQGRNSSEAGAISHARWNGDHRSADQSGNYAWQNAIRCSLPTWAIP